MCLSVDCISPQMNTIASRDQFKPIRIGEDLVVNCTTRDTRESLGELKKAVETLAIG